MGRRKTVKSRVYTFGQCDTLMHRHKIANATGGVPFKRLTGNVQLTGNFKTHYFSIRYYGKRLAVTLARVYRASDGDTLYEVYGVGHPAAADRALSKHRDKRAKELAMWRKVWRKYAPMFTPVEPDAKLGAITACYRMQGGVAIPCGGPAGTTPRSLDPQGVWLARPQCWQQKREVWAAPFKDKLIGLMEKGGFARRGKLFFTRLKKELADEKIGVVQMVWDHECEMLGAIWKEAGLCLSVCTPPSRTRNGRRLVIKMAPYSPDARKHHHVDGDFAYKNAQFFALEDGAKRSEMLRWKCAKDAIAGIKEWVIGDIYIPGPG